MDEIIAIEEPANIDETANNHDESDQESAPETDSERDGPLYLAEDLMYESPAPSIVHTHTQSLDAQKTKLRFFFLIFKLI